MDNVIASVLLVAIAVIGGLTTSLWAGGVFSVSSGLTLPETEFAQMIGYDARDIPNIGGFSDDGANLDNDPSVGSLSTVPGSEEFIVIKLRNTGVTEMLIDKISIIGVDHTFDSDLAGITDQPDVGKFEIYTKLDGDTSSKEIPTIESSEDVRVALKLSSDIPINIEGGKMPIKMYTAQGNVMNYFITPSIAE